MSPKHADLPKGLYGLIPRSLRPASIPGGCPRTLVDCRIGLLGRVLHLFRSRSFRPSAEEESDQTRALGTPSPIVLFWGRQWSA